MLEFVKFVRDHILVAIMFVVGPTIATIGLVLHVIGFVELGLPWWIYVVLGVAIFVASIAALLFGFYQHMHAHIPAKALPATTMQSPLPHTVEPNQAVMPFPAIPPVEPVRPLPALPAVPRSDSFAKNGRVFVPNEITPEFMCNLYEERTQIEGDRLLQPYIGKWIFVSGKVTELSSFSDILQVLIWSSNRKLVNMLFNKNWADKINMLRKNYDISVIGKIKSANGASISIDDCEIADT